MEDTIYYVDTSKQNISFLGYPLNGAYAVFHAPGADSSGLKMIRFDFKSSEPGTMENEKIDMFMTIFDSISKSYGKITNGWVRVQTRDEVIIYDPPVQNGALDIAALIQVLDIDSYTAILLCWNNVRLVSFGTPTYLDFYGYYVDYSEAESSIGYYGLNDEPEPIKDINVGL